MRELGRVVQNQYLTALLLSLMILAPMSGMVGADEGEPERTCTVLVDWDSDWISADGLNWSYGIIHRYRVEFEPAFVNGTSPSAVTVDLSHIRDSVIIGTEADSSFVVAGGEIDITLDNQPEFLDEVDITVVTSEATCFRHLDMTMWNQPAADHEITRETTWSLESNDENASSLYFEGRGWQKRIGESLSSSELGNGSLFLNADTGTEKIQLDLELDHVWMNETYEGIDITRQIFEMRGSGSLSFYSDDGNDNVSIQADVYEAYILRDWENGILTERIRLEGDGNISYNGGSNNSTSGAFGTLSVFYFESWDENGVRRLSDTQIEAQMQIRLQSGEETFSFDLDEFKTREKWLDGIREEQYLKIKGAGEFGFLIEDGQFEVQVNGTVADVHFEEMGGETVEDRLIIDGHYSGTASGSFGLVRQIEDSTIQANATGTNYEVDVIRNEFWLNVSGTPIGPIGEEIQAEHNLTFEYTVPQIDWENRTIRYMFVEENGNTTDEYPENSPILREPTRPSYDGDLNVTGFRETGVVPAELIIGDTFPTLGDTTNTQIEVIGISTGLADGHEVEIAQWVDVSGDEYFSANGAVINEGLLAGLVYEISRTLDFGIPIGEGNSSDLRIIEHQNIERILYPTIITASENTVPSILKIGFREGALFTEGGISHLEITIDDVDTDVISVSIDLSEFGMGLISLSDVGLNGDSVIHDSIWTAVIEHSGLEFGIKNVTVIMEDVWTTVESTEELEIRNSAPVVTSRFFTPDIVYRGDTVEISVLAEDGHGVESVYVDLLSAGGELTTLTFDEDTGKWTGEFTIPDSLSPGERTIPLQVNDLAGGSAFLNEGASIMVLNEAPSITNVSFTQSGEWVSKLEIPKEGTKEYVIEVSIEDPDGVSSAQVKIGRLAPIGQSENWLSLTDDGQGGDRIANDGVFSLDIELRSTLSVGEINYLIRSADIYQSLTPDEQQIHTIELVDSTKIGSDGSNWLAEHGTSVVLVGILMLLAIGATALIVTMRNSDLE
ncbi:MAG: hypothetical protein P8Q35_05130 [Candidatus Thalassarchaeaceae archaeon]|nr:hypothetical protein [Candidatus Thalassarchaeaceae archaeon]